MTSHALDPESYRNRFPYGKRASEQVAFRKEGIRLLDKLRADLEELHGVAQLDVRDRDILWIRGVTGGSDPADVMRRYAAAVGERAAEGAP